MVATRDVVLVNHAVFFLNGRAKARDVILVDATHLGELECILAHVEGFTVLHD